MAFATLKNFTAGYRKRNLIPFGLFSPGDNLSFIETSDPGSIIATTGTVDGVNGIFTIPAFSGAVLNVMKNGITQDPNTMYSLAGNTITFLDPYIPQSGDVITAEII